MLHSDLYSSEREGFILAIRNNILRHSMEKGFNVIIDDTNLNPIHETQIRNIVDAFNKGKNKEDQYKLQIKLFETSVNECIKRDLKREKSVGEKVIRSMYNKFIKQSATLIQDPKLPKAIICDLDGTLALLNGRDPYDASSCENVGINIPVKEILDSFKESRKIIFVSGREDKFLDQTLKFLDKAEFRQPLIYMRKSGDFRDDRIVKEEIFDTFINGKYFIDFILDDRTKVVEMWRDKGLTCLQVNYGDF
jgi:predicted kinase